MASNDSRRGMRAIPGRAMTWLVAVALALPVVAAGCSATPPEDALRASVGSLVDAIEAREPGPIDDVLADDFVGPEGMDRDGARRLARLHFLRHRDIGLLVGPLDVDLHGRTATVRATVVATGGRGGWLPTGGSVYRVETGWRRDGGDWSLTSIRWERDPGASPGG